MKYLKVFNNKKTFFLSFGKFESLDRWYNKQNPYYCWFNSRMRIPKTDIFLEKMINEYRPIKIDSITECENYIAKEQKATEDYVKKNPSQDHLLVGNKAYFEFFKY